MNMQDVLLYISIDIRGSSETVKPRVTIKIAIDCQ